MKRHALFIAIAGFVCLSSIALLFLRQKNELPEPENLSPEDKVVAIASPEFKSMSNDAKKEYIEKSFGEKGHRELFRQSRNLPEEKRKDLRENMRSLRHERRREHMKKYFDLPEEQRQVYLDQLIEEREQRRKQRREKMSEKDQKEMDKHRKNRRKNGPSLDRIKERIESSDPVERAQRSEFRRAMREREAQRK